MTRADLLAILYERLNYQASPATAVTTRLGNALNEAQRRLLREPGLGRLRDTAGGLTFASEASRAYYGLPSTITKVRAITDRTNDRLLQPISLMALRSGDTGLDSTGTPAAYVEMGQSPVARHPATSGVWAVSTSAADAAGPTITIEGILSSGLASGEQTATLTGAARVQIGSLATFTQIVHCTLSAGCAGTISLYDAAAAGNLLASIAIGKTAPAYVGVQLYPTPDAAVTYYVDGLLAVPDMDDATDVPVLPEPFHDLLVHGALVLEYEKRDDPERLMMATEVYRNGVSQLKYFLAAQDAPMLGGSGGVRTTRLGSWTPAGSGF